MKLEVPIDFDKTVYSVERTDNARLFVAEGKINHYWIDKTGVYITVKTTEGQYFHHKFEDIGVTLFGTFEQAKEMYEICRKKEDWSSQDEQ